MTEGDTVETLVVRHLADIEGAVRYLQDVLEPKLWEAISVAMESWAEERDWVRNIDPETEGDYWLAPRAWQVPDNEDDAEFYFALTVIPQEDGEDITSVTSFIGASARGNRYVLLFEREHPKKKRAWQALLGRSEPLLQQLREKGFDTDTRAGTICYPVSLDAIKLGLAFADDDFEAALEPLMAALFQAEQALTLFDDLAGAARTAS